MRHYAANTKPRSAVSPPDREPPGGPAIIAGHGGGSSSSGQPRRGGNLSQSGRRMRPRLDDRTGSNVVCPEALVHFDGVNDGRMLFPLFGPDRTDAAQAQRRPPSPHSEAGVQGTELVGVLSGLRRRGSLTLWIEDAALGDWRTRRHPESGGSK